jgi:hypothetical protein
LLTWLQCYGPLLALRFIRRSAASYLLLKPIAVMMSPQIAGGSPTDAPETPPHVGKPAGVNGAPSPALARSWGGLCGVGHPGFVGFAAVAPTIPMTVPTFSAVTSRQFGGSCKGLAATFRARDDRRLALERPRPRAARHPSQEAKVVVVQMDPAVLSMP